MISSGWTFIHCSPWLKSWSRTLRDGRTEEKVETVELLEMLKVKQIINKM